MTATVETTTTQTVDTTVEVDATSGPVTVTMPPGVNPDRAVTITKTDTTTNPVIISANGVNPLDTIVTQANGAIVAAKNVYSDGATLKSATGGPSGQNTLIPVASNYTISPVDNVVTTITPGTSGTYDFGNLPASDIVIECYERLQWRLAALTPDMMESARRSFNLVQSRWSNLGVNLWETSLQSITLSAGVGTYTLDPTTIAILPAPYIRIWNLSNPTNLTPQFSVTAGSLSATVTQPSNGLFVGNMVNIATPIAIGGTIIFGFYAVTSTPSPNSYTITLSSPPLSTATGGVVPTFTTDGSTPNVTVALTNNGFLAGQTFNVQVPTQVGGLTLNGQYLIVSAATNSFVINATVPSTSVQTVTINGGLAQIQSQPYAQTPTDIVMYPLSRPDYTSLASKLQQGRPTSFWFDRTIVPTVTFWPVPDFTGPYQFQYYKLSQMQDANIKGTSQIDMPYRFMEAYCSAVAAHLSMKWRPELAPALLQYATQMWTEAAMQDTEKVSFYAAPDTSGYFN